MFKLKSTLTDHSIYSRFLKREMLFRILHAEGVDVSQKLNLLFVHDGDDYLHIGKLREQFDQDLMWREGSNNCFILVPPGSSEERWHYYHSEGQHQEDYQNFVYQELLPEIESRFSIDRLGMLGDSLAGAVSLRLALHEPNRWTHLLLQSAAFSEKDVELVENLQTTLPFVVYQSVGLEEDRFISPITQECLYILTRNRQIKAHLHAKHHTYVEEAHDHLWECWREQLPFAMNIFNQ